VGSADRGTLLSDATNRHERHNYRTTPSVSADANLALLMYQMDKDRGEREIRLEEEFRRQRESLANIVQAMEENRPRDRRPMIADSLLYSGDDNEQGNVAD